MIFDASGLPRDTGATDWMDSARLAGMMALFGHPQAPDMLLYNRGKGRFVRYPYGPGLECDPKDFSRDQLVPCIAGYAAQQYLYIPNINLDVPWQAPNGDFLSPSVRNHLRRCCALFDKPTRLGDAWLKLDIWYNSWQLKRWAKGKREVPPEQNQLIAMCVTAGPEWVKRYKEAGVFYGTTSSKIIEGYLPFWQFALRDYWSAWRQESEFCEFMIQKLEAM
jgi:hypothetical protein